VCRVRARTIVAVKQTGDYIMHNVRHRNLLPLNKPAKPLYGHETCGVVSFRVVRVPERNRRSLLFTGDKVLLLSRSCSVFSAAHRVKRCPRLRCKRHLPNERNVFKRMWKCSISLFLGVRLNSKLKSRSTSFVWASILYYLNLNALRRNWRVYSTTM